MTGSAVFGLIVWLLFFRFIVPVLGVFYGTSLIADEVEDKTITLFVHEADPESAGAGGQVPRISRLHEFCWSFLRRCSSIASS